MPCQIKIDQLPTIIREIGEEIGFEAVFKLVDRFGGTSINPPLKVDEHHWLAEVIGLPAAQKLAQLWHGDRIYIPFLKAAKQAVRNKEIIQRYDAGESVRTLALSYHLAERSITRILKKCVL
ncbi:MAG: hypothetical protein H7829_07635 [Magnetococcus sp. THC-1_WYH]